MAIAYRSVATSTNSPTCSKPSGVVSGDILVATVAWYDAIAASVTPPSGWTLFGTATPSVFVGGHVSSKIYWKLATGSEPSDYTWTISSGSYTEVGIIAYSGVDNTTPIDVSSSTESRDGNVTAASVTTTVANTMLVAFLHDYGNAMSTPSGMTQRALWDASINLIADEARAATGATGTRADGAAYSAWNAHLVALKPAGGGGTTEVTQTVTTAWNVRAAPTQTSASAWHIRTAIAQTKASAWAVRTAIAQTKASAWAVRTAVATVTRASAWNVRAAIPKTAASAWHVRAAIAQTQATAWAVRTAVTEATKAAAWHIRAAIAQTRASAWDVESLSGLTEVTQTASSAWNTRSAPTQTSAAAWYIRSAVTPVTSAAAWNVRAAIAQTRVAAWNVRMRAYPHPLIPTWEGGWHVRQSVSTTQSTAWNVASALGEVTQTRAAAWHVRAAPVQTGTAAWHIRAIVTKTGVTAWYVLTPVTSVTRDIAWHVLPPPPTLSLATAWRVLTPLSLSLVSEWGTYRYERDRLTYEFLPTQDRSSEFVHSSRSRRSHEFIHSRR